MRQENLLKQGAEAKIILLPNWNEENRDAIAKHRFKKCYRIPALDEKLTKERVSQEAKMIVRLGKLKGVSTPCLYLVDMDTYTLYMEYIDAPSVRDFIQRSLATSSSSRGHSDPHPVPVPVPVPAAAAAKNSSITFQSIAADIGQGLAKIHDIDVIHGDLTTSNLLIKESGKIVWIDFGLSYISTMAEDKGVDLYVLERAILSTHPSIGTEMFQIIISEYELNSKRSKEVIKRFQEVRSRGRKRVAFG